MPDAPRCFLSYSWDSAPHRDWVRSLATKLRASGIDALLDQFHLQPGADLTLFMERAVRDSQFVLLVCTPNFASKADAGVGGVGYEKAIVTGEIFGGNAHDTKFVPILRAGDAKLALPSYLRSRLFIDFRDDAQFDAACEQLLRHLWGEPLYQAPAIGAKPNFGATAARSTAASETTTSAPSANIARPLYIESFDEPVRDMAEMQQRYGALWVIGRDGPWWGDVVEGVHRLSNTTEAAAVKYSYVGISDAEDRPIALGDARVSVQVTAEMVPGAPQAGAGILYRFDRDTRRYAAFVLSFWGGEEKPRPQLTWLVNDGQGLEVRHSVAPDWLAADQPVALAVEGRGPQIVLSANGRAIHTVRDFARTGGDPGLIAFGRGRFGFDDFTIWPPPSTPSKP